jgi:murein DD-endopeptidase MepM/ murein hydrolase activator NlpD
MLVSENVEKIAYKIWLKFLKSLTYAKRALVWLWFRFSKLADWFGQKYRNSLGFYVYKYIFFLKKKWNGFFAPFGQSSEGVFDKRGTLQIIVLLVSLGVMLPQSKLWSSNGVEIPGRQTLLYKLVGPGDQNFDVEEVTAQTAEGALSRSTRNWHEGAISATPGTINNEPIVTDQGNTRQSMGGMAFVKPIILPGVVYEGGQVNPSYGSNRDSVEIYQVEPGDVLGAIAKRFGVSVSSILAANNLTIRSYIRPGDKLKILPVDGVLHTVKKGDTIAKIAKLYKASADDIVSFNKLETGTALGTGIELIIPHGVKPAEQVIARAPASTQRRFTVLDPVSAPPNSNDNPTAAGYVWPTAVRRITQYYGLRHTGVDIAGPIGTPVYAVRSGTVIKSQCGWNGGYGCYIIIDHGGGVQSLYGHNSQLLVAAGDEVIQGQTISLMGSTGHSTGPHCHFEIRSKGRRVNPLQYIR